MGIFRSLNICRARPRTLFPDSLPRPLTDLGLYEPAVGTLYQMTLDKDQMVALAYLTQHHVLTGTGTVSASPGSTSDYAVTGPSSFEFVPGPTPPASTPDIEMEVGDGMRIFTAAAEVVVPFGTIAEAYDAEADEYYTNSPMEAVISASISLKAGWWYETGSSLYVCEVSAAASCTARPSFGRGAIDVSPPQDDNFVSPFGGAIGDHTATATAKFHLPPLVGQTLAVPGANFGQITMVSDRPTEPSNHMELSVELLWWPRVSHLTRSPI